MLSQFLLCALCLVPSASSRALPSKDQVPFVSSSPQNHAKPEHMGVKLIWRRSGVDYESSVEVPLRWPIRGEFDAKRLVVSRLNQRLGSLLHNEPQNDSHEAVVSMKLAAVLDMETGARGCVEEVEKVRCRIEPEFSAEELSAASASGVDLEVSPAFGIQDGIIILDRSDSRWFMAGRSIKSVECW